MPNQADVRSFDAIESVRAALLMFAKQAEDGLAELDAEMRRMMDWLEHNRPGFWAEQERKAHDLLHDAKQALNRCLMFPVGVNERPACSEERAAVKKARAHLAYCQAKREKLRHWVRELHHELHSYEGRTTHLKRVIEAEAPQAAAVLGKILDRLEAYKQLSAGGGLPAPGPVFSGAGTNGAGSSEQADGDADPSGVVDSPPARETGEEDS